MTSHLSCSDDAWFRCLADDDVGVAAATGWHGNRGRALTRTSPWGAAGDACATSPAAQSPDSLEQCAELL